MVQGTQEQADLASDGVAIGRDKRNYGNRLRFDYCPHCFRKGLYKVTRRYERYRCCGLHRMLLPGQDF